MLDIAQLQTLMLFPFRDAGARKNFLIACVVMLANFIIPILPMLAALGYIARIMRQIIDEQRDPTMPEWDDASSLINDGLRVWGFHLVLSIPLIVMMVGIMGALALTMTIGVGRGDSNSLPPFFMLGMMLLSVAMLAFLLFSLPYTVISMVGTCHVITKQSFSAGFAFKEWWPIFIKNIGAFIIYFLIAFAIYYVMIFVMQIMMMTIILICLFPILFPAVMAYFLLLQYTLIAKAYAEGREKVKLAALAQQSA